jgi:hypothetical protein
VDREALLERPAQEERPARAGRPAQAGRPARAKAPVRRVARATSAEARRRRASLALRWRSSSVSCSPVVAAGPAPAVLVSLRGVALFTTLGACGG